MTAENTNTTPDRETQRPKVVCLCGSTRFYKEFQRANYEESMKGHIVLSVGFYMHASEEAHGEKWGCTPAQKRMLDAVYLKKIEMADEVLVLDVHGYIGESTRSEINHAESLGKRIRYLSQETIATLRSLKARDASTSTLWEQP